MENNLKLEEIGLLNLNSNDLVFINGGESGWYWLAYAAGTVWHGLKDGWENHQIDKAHPSVILG